MSTPLHTAGILQTRAYRILQYRVNDCLTQHGLNHGQWVMLGVISDAPDGIRLNQTADVLGVKAPLVTAMANDLIALGYIKRQSHDHDRRAKLLTVSDAGKQLLREIESDMNATLSPLMKGLTQQEIDTFFKVLETIITNSESKPSL